MTPIHPLNRPGRAARRTAFGKAACIFTRGAVPHVGLFPSTAGGLPKGGRHVG
jgi:hypothetical protein